MLTDIEKETVDYIDNFDATLKEPVYLPSLLPNLLLMVVKESRSEWLPKFLRITLRS